MSTYLRKCLDLAPTPLTRPVPPSEPPIPNDYRTVRVQSWWSAMRATTSHLRILADWPSIQNSPDPPGTLIQDGWALEALDRQIEAAHEDGLKIILLPYRYPSWVNDTANIASGLPNFDFYPWDRFARLALYQTAVSGGMLNQKALTYRMPPDGFGPESRWARYVGWLIDRYGAKIAAIEVVNEPNLQLWPQRTQPDPDIAFAQKWDTADSRLVVTEQVAQMMITVDALSRAHGDSWTLLAPSCSDSETVTQRRYQTIVHPNPTLTETFTGALLTALEGLGFVADDRWVWAYHNYTDFERDRRHVVDVRALLESGGWKGRRLDGGPELWGTEGGVRLNVMGTRFNTTDVGERKALQAKVMAEGLARHHYAKGAGAGIGMFTQYTTFADPGFDDGLLDSVIAGGVARPALAVWSGMPEYVSSPVQRAAWRPQP